MKLLLRQILIHGIILSSLGRAHSSVLFLDIDPTVVFSSLRANKDGRNAIITWSTSSETISDYFQVEHSFNASTWTAIGKISAKGESTITNNYSFTHISPDEAINYYRLKATGKDGSSVYSRIVSLSMIVPPAVFTSFSATQEAGGVKLSWDVSSEYKNEYFLIESANENSWDTVGTIKGRNSNESSASYALLDKSPKPGKTYYFLTAVGTNFKYRYEVSLLLNIDPGLIITSLPPRETSGYKFYPNPATDKIHFEGNRSNPVVNISVANSLGQIILRTDETFQNEIHVKNFPPGLYFISIRLRNGQVIHHKIIKQ